MKERKLARQIEIFRMIEEHSKLQMTFLSLSTISLYLHCWLLHLLLCPKIKQTVILKEEEKEMTTRDGDKTVQKRWQN